MVFTDTDTSINAQQCMHHSLNTSSDLDSEKLMLMKNFLAVSLAVGSIICGASSISAQTTPSASDKDQMDKIKSEIEKKIMRRL